MYNLYNCVKHRQYIVIFICDSNYLYVIYCQLHKICVIQTEPKVGYAKGILKPQVY